MLYLTVFALVFGFLVSPVSAQASYHYSSSGSCVSLSRQLSIGMRGNDVSELQRFLATQNYSGSSDTNWMITGYFGRATEAAVKIFQSINGLSPVGIVGTQTRLALERASCGGYSGTPYFPTPQTYPVYPSQPPITYPTNVSIVSLNPYSGNVGTPVTIYGSGFTQEGNTVLFGRGIITGIRSFDGRTISFTVPSLLSGYGSDPVQIGTYPVSVKNQFGYQSNAVQFSVTGLTISGAPQIIAVNGPNSVNTNTANTWTLTAFAPSGTQLTTSVTWGDEYLNVAQAQLASQQIYGTGINQNVSFSHTYTQPGTYVMTFRVRNAQGQESVSTMSVVVSGAGSSGSVQLLSVSPTSAQKGVLLTLSGSNFTATDNEVHFGIGGMKNVSSVGSSLIYYTIPHYLSTCDFVVGTCTAPIVQVQAGVYPVYVKNSNGTSQTINVVVQ